jgi:hypothetical protein
MCIVRSMYRLASAAVLALLLVVAACAPRTTVPPPRPEVIDRPIEDIEAERDDPVNPEADVPIIEADPDDEEAFDGEEAHDDEPPPRR